MTAPRSLLRCLAAGIENADGGDFRQVFEEIGALLDEPCVALQLRLPFSAESPSLQVQDQRAPCCVGFREEVAEVVDSFLPANVVLHEFLTGQGKRT